MAVIELKKEREPVNTKIQTPHTLHSEISEYMEYARLENDTNSFFNGAAEFVLKKDAGFKAWKKEKKAAVSTQEKTEESTL